MTRYLSRLSRAQIVWLAGSLVAAAAVCGIGIAMEPQERAEAPPLSTAMSLREMAPRLDTTGKALARELDLPLEVSKDKAVAELGVSDFVDCGAVQPGTGSDRPGAMQPVRRLFAGVPRSTPRRTAWPADYWQRTATVAPGA